MPAASSSIFRKTVVAPDIDMRSAMRNTFPMSVKLQALPAAILSAFAPTVAAPLNAPAPAGSVRVCSHRADWQCAPENSIPALENAIAFGVDVIETDVRLARDGEIVIMHDWTVDRTTDGKGAVKDLSLEQIKALRLKTNWGDTTQYRVPTLEEFAAKARGRASIHMSTNTSQVFVRRHSSSGLRRSRTTPGAFFRK